jgi:hypothetical protein
MPEGVETMGDVKTYLVSLHYAAVGCQIDAEAVQSILNDIGPNRDGR